MRYKQGVYWLMLVFGVTAGGIASSQTDAARALVIDVGSFENWKDDRPSDGPFATQVRTDQNQPRPRIDMRQPGEKRIFTAKDPLAVDILFHPANDGAALNMETLRVVVLKGWFGQDITDTVRQYVQGNAIRVPEVDFKGYSGKFQVGVSIEDNQRRGNQLWFTVTIQI